MKTDSRPFAVLCNCKVAMWPVVYLVFATLFQTFFVGCSGREAESNSAVSRSHDDTSVSVLSGQKSLLTLSSSDPMLVERFNWARNQALSYVRDVDPVGAWYEAALPGRDAFCMRDVSHQAVGAHVLGLAEHTRNMLLKFATNISETKDWCSYWEINRMDEPAPADFRNDKAFWYNLPANFDVLAASYRMYQWTGDSTYISDPRFLNFYARTVSDYVKRWQLEPDEILERNRYMNLTDVNLSDPYEYARGIPSYHEGDTGQTQLGIDLLALQYAGYQAYAEILDRLGRGAEADSLRWKSDRVHALINSAFWDLTDRRFYSLLRTDGSYSMEGGMPMYLLYAGVPLVPEKRLETVISLADMKDVGIELKSYLPEVLYENGAHADAYRITQELGSPRTVRREYPEVSFALVGSMVSGLAGVLPDVESNSVQTLSRLVEPDSWVSISHIPVLGYDVSLRHDGKRSSTLENQSTSTISWKAAFYGNFEFLAVDGLEMRTRSRVDKGGLDVVYVETPVAPGKRVTVTIDRSEITGKNPQ